MFTAHQTFMAKYIVATSAVPLSPSCGWDRHEQTTQGTSVLEEPAVLQVLVVFLPVSSDRTVNAPPPYRRSDLEECQRWLSYMLQERTYEMKS